MDINPNEVIANLLNKNAMLTLQVAQLEVALQAGENDDNGQ